MVIHIVRLHLEKGKKRRKQEKKKEEKSPGSCKSGQDFVLLPYPVRACMDI